MSKPQKSLQWRVCALFWVQGCCVLEGLGEGSRLKNFSYSHNGDLLWGSAANLSAIFMHGEVREPSSVVLESTNCMSCL